CKSPSPIVCNCSITWSIAFSVSWSRTILSLSFVSMGRDSSLFCGFHLQMSIFPLLSLAYNFFIHPLPNGALTSLVEEIILASAREMNFAMQLCNGLYLFALLLGIYGKQVIRAHCTLV